jgi:hypothetical protein
VTQVSVPLTGIVLSVVLGAAIQMLPKKYHGLATVEADSPTPQAIPNSAMLRDQQSATTLWARS